MKPPAELWGRRRVRNWSRTEQSWPDCATALRKQNQIQLQPMVPKRNPGPAHPEGWSTAQALMSHGTALAAHSKCSVAPASDPASSDTQNSCKQDLAPWDVAQPCLEQEKEHHCPWSRLERVVVNPAQPGESSRALPCAESGLRAAQKTTLSPSTASPLICSYLPLGFHHQPHQYQTKEMQILLSPFHTRLWKQEPLKSQGCQPSLPAPKAKKQLRPLLTLVLVTQNRILPFRGASGAIWGLIN